MLYFTEKIAESDTDSEMDALYSAFEDERFINAYFNMAGVFYVEEDI